MKKLSNKGFTLIELLAVITIMGILMMVAIPAVSRTIENSRRDTFADIAHEYVNAVRNSYIADNISCYTGGYDRSDKDAAFKTSSATPKGRYYFPICTSDDDGSCVSINVDYKGKEKKADGSGYEEISSTKTIEAEDIVLSTTDLMESGGKSPFGSSDMYGYVVIRKTVEGEGTENPKTKITYSIKLVDSGLHGIASPEKETQIKRAKISTAVKESALDNNANIFTEKACFKTETVDDVETEEEVPYEKDPNDSSKLICPTGSTEKEAPTYPCLIN